MKATLQTIAFAGPRRIALGALADVAGAAKAALDGGETAPVLIFDAVTGQPIDVDFSGSADDVRARLPSPAPDDPERGRGRPKLGVVAREVTLLPRHWDWLGAQRGGASAALRRLVDEARRGSEAADLKRHGREALYRFITAMAGDAENYEEATRALFAGDEAKFVALTAPWPTDIRAHAMTMARPAFGHAPSPLDGLISWTRRGVVDRAIAAAFPGAAVEAAERMVWGASGAGVFKLTVGGAPYVLRLERPPSPHTDPARHYACLKIAAEAGLAPPLLYGNAEDRVAVMGFVQATPGDLPQPRQAALEAIGQAVRRLHAAPLFPPRPPLIDIIGGMIAPFQASGVTPDGALEGAWTGFARISAVYPRDEADLVSSHNDLNPSNLMFEGMRPWMVDWEIACAADRYVDLATVANFFTADEAEEEILLYAYFGAAPGSYRRARFYLMQQVNRLLFGMILTGGAVAERPGSRLTAQDLDTPSLSEMRAEMRTLGTPEGRLRFGAAFLNAARRGMEGPEFEAALTRVKPES